MNNIWAVGSGGTIVKWNGVAWSTQSSGASNWLWGVWGTNVANVWAAGEGGTIVGAPLKGRVMIVDDVMSAGTAVRESIALIQAHGATPHAVAIALDRQEMATENGADVPYSAVQYVRQHLGLQVCAIARLADLLQYLAQHAGDSLGEHHARVLAYRERYGVDD